MNNKEGLFVVQAGKRYRIACPEFPAPRFLEAWLESAAVKGEEYTAVWGRLLSYHPNKAGEDK